MSSLGVNFRGNKISRELIFLLRKDWTNSSQRRHVLFDVSTLVEPLSRMDYFINDVIFKLIWRHCNTFSWRHRWIWRQNQIWLEFLIIMMIHSLVRHEVQVAYISLAYAPSSQLIPDFFSVCNLQMYLSSRRFLSSALVMPCSMMNTSRSFSLWGLLTKCFAKSQLSGRRLISYLCPLHRFAMVFLVSPMYMSSHFLQ